MLLRSGFTSSIRRLIRSSKYKFSRYCDSSPVLVKTEELGFYRVVESLHTNDRTSSWSKLSSVLLTFIYDLIFNMTETCRSPFTLPERVRGMTCLDRNAFSLVVNVPGLKVPLKAVAPVSHRFKKLLLKLPKVKPIAVLDTADPDKATHKLFLFNPAKVKSEDDFGENNREFFLTYDVCLMSFRQYDLRLTYENWTYNEVLDAILPQDAESISGFSTVGHIAHLNLRDHLLDYKHIIGDVILDKLSSVRTVVNKLQTIDNTYRNFQMEVLAGEPDFVTVVREHGFSYKLDFSKVYWNSRLATEHQRLVELVKPGDVLFDVFAGVGPFAIPAAKKGCFVHANDLNPESYRWLQHNIDLNKVTGNVKGYNLDGREFIATILRAKWMELLMGQSHGGCHVVMNLPAIAIEFLDVFVGLIPSLEDADVVNADLPIVHCYCFSRSEDPVADASERTAAALGLVNFESLKDRNVRIVRNVAPGKEMLCVTFRLPLSVLVGKESVLKGVNEEPSIKKMKSN